MDRPACLSVCGATTFVSECAPNEILVGTVGGVFILAREDSTRWRVARKTLEGCHVHALVIEPSSGLTFAGACKGSIYASPDFGRTWEHRDRGLTQRDIYCLNFTQAGGRVKLYAGTEPAHLFESDDLGENWREISSLHAVPCAHKATFPAPPFVGKLKDIAFDPQRPQRIYASIEVGGLLRSDNAGETWVQLEGFHPDVHRLVLRPSDPRWMYITGGDGIYRSRDQGAAWEHLTTRSSRIAYPDALIIHPRREELMFTAGAGNNPAAWISARSAEGGIARSRDGGQTWEALQQGLAERIKGNMEAMAIDVWNGSFSLFAASTDGEVFLSEDEGGHWNKIIDGLPPISKGGHYLNIR